jgi:hypothetical protein
MAEEGEDEEILEKEDRVVKEVKDDFYHSFLS